jgi:hypothetical protein
MSSDNKVVAFAPAQNGKNYSGDKELTSHWSVVVLNSGDAHAAKHSGGMVELIDVRCWTGRSKSASTVYASIWVQYGNYCAGHGKAGGYGYHKASAAIEDAIRSAGFTLERSIGGVGESAIEGALRAIAKFQGFDTCLVIRH